jgi:hypothetical protein
MKCGIFIGYSFRAEPVGWLEYENAVCARNPLACLLTIERAVSSSKTRELPPTAERCSGVSSPGSTSTVRRHARLSDLPGGISTRGRRTQTPRRGRTSGRVFGRLRSGVKPEIPFTSRRPEAATLYFAGTGNGPLERDQDSQRVSRANGILLFEPTGVDGARTVTDKNIIQRNSH